MDFSPSPGPIYSIGTGSVAKNGSVRFPVYVEDPDLPLAITMTSDGAVSAWGVWKPDLELQLLKADQSPYLIANPFYPCCSPDPFLTDPRSISACPNPEAGDCGLVGAQETFHLPLPFAASDDYTLPGPHHWLEIVPFGGFPNNGTGGTFTLEFSNAYSNSFGPEPKLCLLTANAGLDQTVIDTDGSGGEVPLAATMASETFGGIL